MYYYVPAISTCFITEIMLVAQKMFIYYFIFFCCYLLLSTQIWFSGYEVICVHRIAEYANINEKLEKWVEKLGSKYNQELMNDD